MAYSIGTISITSNSSTITGNGTYFVQVAKAQKADLLFVHYEGQDRILQLVSVVDDLTLQVKQLDGSVFEPGSSASSLKYGLVQNFTDTVTAKLAQRVADLQTQWFTREQQMTGWFESNQDTYPVTGFLGEQVDIPTPAKIAALAQVAMEASDTLAQMATAIEQNQTTLATVAPRLTTFESQYQFVVSANNNVAQKHNEVVLKHSEVLQAKAEVAQNLNTITHNTEASYEYKSAANQSATEAKLNQEQALAAASLAVLAQSEATEAQDQSATIKGEIKTLKAEFESTSTQAVNSINTAASTVQASAQQTTAHANQTKSEISDFAQGIQLEIDDRVSSFNQSMTRFHSGIQTVEAKVLEHKNRAVVAENNVIISADKVFDSELSVLSTAVEVTATASVVTQHKNTIDAVAIRIHLSELHARAHSAIAVLATEQLVSINSNLNTAFGAVLAGTLTTQQINDLF